MKLITLQIDPGKARQVYKTADAAMKAVLEASAPSGFFSDKITDRIKSYEDACADQNEEPMDERQLLSLGFRPDELARRKVETITRALNEGTVMDWENSNQQKWFPYFRASSGFAFVVTYYGCSFAHAGVASRLYFKSDELATYAGRQFKDLYKTFILNG